MKINSTSELIVSKLSHYCQCAISAAYITAAQLSCDPQQRTHVIYRARLSSTSDVSIGNFTNFLREWVTTGSASVTLEYVQLNLDATCVVTIDSFDDPICPSAPTTLSQTPTIPAVVKAEISTTNTIIAVAVSVAVGVIVVVACIIAVIFYQNHFSGGKKRLVIAASEANMLDIVAMADELVE